MIGYNLCYSTYLGRLKNGLNPELEPTMGVMDHTPSPEGLLQCGDDITIIPNGTLFCPKSHRHGVLPLILDEILSTRIMVKKAIKHAKETTQERLKKILNARQLALKMISNVTYGYTAAGFSGRMPCAQVADAIVQVCINTMQDLCSSSLATDSDLYVVNRLAALRLKLRFGWWSLAPTGTPEWSMATPTVSLCCSRGGRRLTLSVSAKRSQMRSRPRIQSALLFKWMRPFYRSTSNVGLSAYLFIIPTDP